MNYLKHIILFGILSFLTSVNAQVYKFNSFTKLNGLPSNKITSIKQDNKGYLWIGTNEGLSRYDGNSFVNYNSFNGLTDNVIEKIWIDENNNMFASHPNSRHTQILPNNTFKTADEIPISAIIKDSIRLHDCYIENSFSIKLMNKNINEIDFRNGLVRDTLLSVFVDKENILWIGTKNSGLFNLALQNFPLYSWNYLHKLNHSYQLNSETYFLTYNNSIVKLTFREGEPRFNEIYRTNSKTLNCGVLLPGRELYYGTNTGMYLYFEETNTEYSFRELANKNVTDIEKLDNGNLIIIANNKLYEYKSYNNKIQLFSGLENFKVNSIQKINNIIHLLGKGDVMRYKNNKFSSLFTVKHKVKDLNFVHLSEPSQSGFWMSTSSNGLFRWKSATTELVDFNKNRKLPYTSIVQTYQSGNTLWITTQHGVIEYDLKLNSYQFFGERYFNKPNFLPFIIQNKTNTYAVSNLGLFEYFDSDKKNSKVSNLSIVQIAVKGIPIDIDTNFEIENNDFPIEFNYQSISFKDKIYYQYALSGENPNWSTPTLNTSVSYNSLPKGDYTFKVRTYDPINEVTLENIELKFTVKPPFWQTIMFVYLLLGVIGLVVFIFYLVRIWRLKTQKLTLERMVDEKTYTLTAQNQHIEQFSYSLSHDLKNPINNIKGLVEIMEGAPEEDQKEIRKMLMNSAMLLEDKIKATLNTLKQMQANKKNVEKLYFEAIFDIVKRSLLILIRENDVRFIVDFRAKTILFNASVLESIFYNLISNSIKYGPKNKQIVIKLTSYTENGLTKLIFEDNGIGFDTQKDLDKVFSIFERVNENDQTGGMGIGLYMIKQMIELNGGSLNVESKVNVGTKFFVSLKPMDQEKKGI